MVKVGQTHRRRDAGEARDGGARWKALAPVRRTVAVAGPGVAGVDGGELGCGCRSSVVHESPFGAPQRNPEAHVRRGPRRRLTAGGFDLFDLGFDPPRVTDAWAPSARWSD